MNDKDRQAIISLDCGENGDSRTYPGVHFSMVINLTNAIEHCMDSTMFLIKLLIREVNVEFELYNSQQALGRVIFAVQNEFAISGMLTGGDQCISEKTRKTAVFSIKLCSPTVMRKARSSSAPPCATW